MEILSPDQSEQLYQLGNVANKLNNLKSAELNLEFIQLNISSISGSKIEVIAKIVKADIIERETERYRWLYKEVFGGKSIDGNAIVQACPRSIIEVNQDEGEIRV